MVKNFNGSEWDMSSRCDCVHYVVYLISFGLFRAPEQKFRSGSFVSGAPNSRDEQKKGHSVRACLKFGPKSSDEQKTRHSLRSCSNFGSTSSDKQNKVIASADVRISARNQK